MKRKGKVEGRGKGKAPLAGGVRWRKVDFIVVKSAVEEEIEAAEAEMEPLTWRGRKKERVGSEIRDVMYRNEVTYPKEGGLIVTAYEAGVRMRRIGYDDMGEMRLT